MHISKGEMKALIDGELPLERNQLLQTHLLRCGKCQALHKEQVSYEGAVSKRMGSLDMDVEGNPQFNSASQALRRFQTLAQEGKENDSMYKRLQNKIWTPAGVGLSLAAMLLLSLAFPTVRAAAVDFLGLFRIQQVEVVEFDPSALPSELSNQFVEFENVLLGQMETTGGGPAFEVADGPEASQQAGFQVRMPVQEGGVRQRLMVQPGGTATFDIDLDLWQGLLHELDRADIRLPRSLDGETVTITMPDVVTLYLGSCAEQGEPDSSRNRVHRDCMIFLQSPSPIIDAPADLPVDELGQAFLQLAGMSPAEAARFSDRIDWYTTLILPVPQGSEYREVEINGAEGTLLQSTNSYQVTHYNLIWVRNGFLYSIIGSGNPQSAISLANSLR